MIDFTRAFLITVMVILDISFGVKGECSEKFKAVTSSHTACRKPATGSLGSYGVNNDQQKEITDQHNTLRASIVSKGQPAAANMFKVYWDNEIAMIAQRQAESCVYGHDENYQRNIPGRLTLGQNIAAGYSSWQGAIDGWFNEVDDYSYSNNAKKYEINPNTGKGVQIGHYTQVVWATTTRIGCGYAECSNIGGKRYYVCNYGPGGNSHGKWPYKSGSSMGSDCPNTKTNGLCDCGSKICLNLGELDPNTCTCKCKKSYHRPSDCGMLCSSASDSSICNSWVSQGYCRTMSNVPVEYCPKSCNQCPHGDITNQYEGGAIVPGGSSNGNSGSGSGTTVPKTTKIPTKPPTKMPTTKPPTKMPTTPTETPLQSCVKADNGQCKSYGASYCTYSMIQTYCPAMCGKCKAAETANDCPVGNIKLEGEFIIYCTSSGIVKKSSSAHMGCIVQGVYMDPDTQKKVNGYMCSCKSHGQYSTSSSCQSS